MPGHEGKACSFKYSSESKVLRSKGGGGVSHANAQWAEHSRQREYSLCEVSEIGAYLEYSRYNRESSVAAVGK